MSLYLGKNNSNIPVLNVNKNQRTVAQLKAGMDYDTIFHSSLPYLTYKSYEGVRQNVYDPLTYSIGYLLSVYSGHTYFGTMYEFPQEFYVTENLNKLCIVIINNYKTLGYWADSEAEKNHAAAETRLGNNWFAPFASNLGAPGPANSGSPYPTTLKRWLFVPTKIHYLGSLYYCEPLTSVKILVTNITLDKTYQQNPTPGDIRLSSEGLSLSGTNLTNLKYISGERMSSTDLGILVNGSKYMYLVGEILTTAPILVSSTPSRTVLYKGVNPLVDSDVSTGHYIYKGSFNKTFNVTAVREVQDIFEYFIISKCPVNKNSIIELTCTITSSNIAFNGSAPNGLTVIYLSNVKSYGDMILAPVPTARISGGINIGQDEVHISVGGGAWDTCIPVQVILLKDMADGFSVVVKTNSRYTNCSGNFSINIVGTVFSGYTNY